MKRALSRPAAIVAAALLVTAGAWAGLVPPWQRGGGPTRIGPTDPAVAAAEQARRPDETAVREVSLTAAPATVDLGDRSVETWAFNGTVPGPEIRLRAGEVVRARVRNELPEPLTIHWHGIALRNDMDGVPGVTQAPIEPGDTFTYEFTAPDPGTYFYHPHTGTQLDRGLYGPLIVEAPERSSGREITLLLDDWIDGTGRTPDEVLATLRSGMGPMGSMGGGGMDGMGGMGGMDMGGMGGMVSTSTDQPLGKDTGDVDYPLYVINGRAPANAPEFAVTAGERVRLRLVNAASDTPFRVALGGNRLTVVATDGFPVEPVTVDTLLLGMGERYDVVVTVPGEGVFPFVAVAEGKGGRAVAALRSGPGDAPRPDSNPAELGGTLLSPDDLRPLSGTALSAGPADRTYRTVLTGDMAGYRWGITAPKQSGVTLPVRRGERVRLVIENRTMMWHPIHLHGHTFQVVNGSRPGPRKDTVIVPAMRSVTVEFVADNPGQWALHCHNIYHAEAGMLTVLSYVK